MYSAAKLADVFGRKPILVGLTTLFLLGSYGCGVAQTLPQIVVARAFYIGMTLLVMIGFAIGSLLVTLTMSTASDIPKAGTSFIGQMMMTK